MAAYREPFLAAGEARRPTLSWPRQIPIAGTPADVVAIARDYAGWLNESPIPKLFINAEPGSLTTGRIRDFCRTWPNQTEITVAGAHRSEEHTSELQSLMRISYAVFCLKKKNYKHLHLHQSYKLILDIN